MLALKPLVKEALAESRFGAATFSDEKFQNVVERTAGDNIRYGVLAAYQNDNPVGFAQCNIGEPLVATGMLVTTVQIMFVCAALRVTLLGGKVANGLINGVQSWSKARDGTEVMIHLTSGVKSAQTHKLLKRRGFETIGGSYAR